MVSALNRYSPARRHCSRYIKSVTVHLNHWCLESSADNSLAYRIRDSKSFDWNWM